MTEIKYESRPDERDRPQVMFLWIWVFIFNPVVLFLAPSYAKKARQLGFKEVARYWVPFWLTLSGYVVGAISIALVLTSVSSITSSYSSPGAPPTTATTAPATTTAGGIGENHSRVLEDRFPPVVPLANDPQSRQLESLMLADGNNQYESTSDVHCVQDLTQPTKARPQTDVDGITTVWNCDSTRTFEGSSAGQYEHAVVWNGGDNPPKINPSDPPSDWSMYERSN